MFSLKIAAIRYLQRCFKKEPKYRKEWQDYIELIVTEQLEENQVEMPLPKLKVLRTDIADHVIRMMFDADWWKAQQ